MFNSTNTPFTMPVMPATGGYADGAGWGDGGWLWIIVVFALLFGWGNNGFGNGFGNGGGYAATVATQADIQRDSILRTLLENWTESTMDCVMAFTLRTQL